jgi:hypothetical protein
MYMTERRTSKMNHEDPKFMTCIGKVEKEKQTGRFVGEPYKPY